MNTPALLSYIKANPNDTDAEIAAAFNAAADRYEITWVTPEGLISRLGAAAGGRVLAALEVAASSDAVVKWAVKRLETSSSGLNAGDAATRGMVQQLADAAVLTQPDASALLALAPDTHGGDVTEADVTVARAQLERSTQAEQLRRDAQTLHDSLVGAIDVWAANGGDAPTIPAVE